MKSLFEQLGGTYTLQGDYYLPDLDLPTEEETQPIGIWGQRHKRYLQDHKRVTCTNLLTSGSLNAYLADINEQAENMSSRLVKEMAKMQGVTEQLKTKNQMVWVGKNELNPQRSYRSGKQGDYTCIKIIASDRFGLRLFLKSVNEVSLLSLYV